VRYFCCWVLLKDGSRHRIRGMSLARSLRSHSPNVVDSLQGVLLKVSQVMTELTHPSRQGEFSAQGRRIYPVFMQEGKDSESLTEVE
jgi:hypothetical protein